MIFVYLGIGCLLLLTGSEAIRGAGTHLLRVVGFPSILVSVLIVSLVLSAPVFSVALEAAARGLPDVALGDIVGSCVVNLLLVLGVGALLSPLPAPPRTVFRDMAVLFAASAAVWIVLLERAVTPLTGAILMGAWLGYIALVLFTEIGRPQQTFAIDLRNGNAARNPGVSALLLAVGAVCLFFGARFTTVFAVVSARTIHAPQAAFAATIVALGTALPALVATVASAQRGHSFAASTQVLASTIFNLLLLFGVVALMAPEPAATTFARFDIPVLMVGIALVAGFMLSGWRLTRWHGVLLLFGYLGYMVLTGLRCGAFSHGG